MANEAILVQQLETRFFEATIATGSSGTDIAKGTIMKWGSDPNTVVVSSGDGDLFAGILQSEHKGGAGVTSVSLGRRGKYAMKITAGGTTVLGEPVKIAGANLLEESIQQELETIKAVPSALLRKAFSGEL